jgi:hypothetical protein
VQFHLQRFPTPLSTVVRNRQVLDRCIFCFSYTHYVHFYIVEAFPNVEVPNAAVCKLDAFSYIRYSSIEAFALSLFLFLVSQLGTEGNQDELEALRVRTDV